jgi:hypothetical protein
MSLLMPVRRSMNSGMRPPGPDQVRPLTRRLIHLHDAHFGDAIHGGHATIGLDVDEGEAPPASVAEFQDMPSSFAAWPDRPGGERSGPPASPSEEVTAAAAARL